jgi:hypothetical protein
MNIKYGKIDIDIDNLCAPDVVSFFSWRDDFFKIPNSEKFDVYLHGSFLHKLLDNVGTPNDIDIILTGNHNIEDIENVIYQGIKIGIEKYGILIDIRWDDKINYLSPGLASICGFDTSKSLENSSTSVNNYEFYVHGDKLIIDGKNWRGYKSTIKLADSLYKVTYLGEVSEKHTAKAKSGYIYKEPLLINY